MINKVLHSKQLQFFPLCPFRNGITSHVPVCKTVGSHRRLKAASTIINLGAQPSQRVVPLQIQNPLSALSVPHGHYLTHQSVERGFHQEEHSFVGLIPTRECG